VIQSITVLFLAAFSFIAASGCSRLRYAPVMPESGCNLDCHTATVIGGEYPLKDPKHQIHFGKKGFDCVLCHNNYENSPTHKNRVLDSSNNGVDVVSFSSDIPIAGVWDKTIHSCSSIGCHPDANWYDSAPPAGCTFCHSPGNTFPNAPDPFLTGSHQGHSAKDCQECHFAYNQNISHSNGVLDNPSANPAMISFIDSGASPPTYSGGNCSNVVCHGNFSGGNNQTVTWGGVVSCASSPCHGGVSGTGNPADSTNPSPSHSSHVSMLLQATNPATGLNYTEPETCSGCHSGGGAGALNHIDGKIDIVFNYPGGSQGAASGGGFNPVTGDFAPVSCSNTYCHGAFSGGNSYTVNSNQSSADSGWCGSCHSTAPTSVKHSKHLTKYPNQCGYCHQGYTSSSTPLNHINFSKDVVFGYPHPANTSGTPSFDSFSKTCSNVYCHGNFPRVTLNGTPNTQTGNLYSPTWLDSSTISCGACHGSPANNYSSPSHGQHTSSSAPYFNDPARIESCDACHNFGADTVRTFGTTSTQGSYGTTNHANFSINGSGVNGDLSFKAPDTVGSLASRTGAVGYTLPRVAGAMTTWNSATTTCSNSWCHGNFEGAVTGNNSSPNWLDSTTAGCGSCHTNSAPATNSHPKHTTAPYSFACETCHGTATGHVNGNIGGTDAVVTFNALNPNGSFNVTTKQCSNLYCHGNTTGAGDWNLFTYNTSAKDNDPVWTAAQGGGPGSVTCGACHDAVSPNLTTGAHLTHTGNNGTTQYNFPCRRCHADTFTGDTTVLGAGHANGILQVLTDSNNPDAVYNPTNKTCSSAYCHGNFTGGNTLNVADWDNGTGGACGNCHQLSPPNSVFGSHDRHTNTNATGGYNYGCETCHNGIASGNEGGAISLNIALHVNFSRDIIFNTLADQGPGTVASYNSTSHTCSNTYCHGDFVSALNVSQPEGNTANAPIWGGSAQCGSCHGETTGLNANIGIPNTDTKWNASGESHVRHAGNAGSGGYGYPCGFCHQGSYQGTLSVGNGTGGAFETGQKQPGYLLHANGVRDFSFFTSFAGTSPVRTPGAAYQEGSCSNLYCHSNGWSLTSVLADAGGISSPVWGGISKSVVTCTSCHNNGGANRAPFNNTPGGKDHYNGNTHQNGCVHCHIKVTSSLNADDPVADTIVFAGRRHVNRWKNVSFGVATGHITTATNGFLQYSRTNGTCSLKCHNHNHTDKTGWYDLDKGGISGGQWIYEP